MFDSPLAEAGLAAVDSFSKEAAADGWNIQKNANGNPFAWALGGLKGLFYSAVDFIAPDDTAELEEQVGMIASLNAAGLLTSKIASYADDVGSAAGSVPEAAVDAKKLNHIFGNARHGFDEFLRGFGGDQSKAFGAIQNAAQQEITAQGITGVFERAVTVGGSQITVRGTVLDGVVKIGTAFIP
jgi:hypothetical protein